MSQTGEIQINGTSERKLENKYFEGIFLSLIKSVRPSLLRSLW